MFFFYLRPNHSFLEEAKINIVVLHIIRFLNYINFEILSTFISSPYQTNVIIGIIVRETRINKLFVDMFP